MQNPLPLDRFKRDEQARIQLVDVMMGFFTLVALMVMAPYIYQFIGMASGAADPFSSLLLQLVVPLILLALILSMGVSAQGGA